MLFMLTQLSFALEGNSKISSCTLSNTTAFEAGEYKIQGDLVNLRNAPSTDGKVLTQIPLASDVLIGDCEKEETIGQKKGCWEEANGDSEVAHAWCLL